MTYATLRRFALAVAAFAVPMSLSATEGPEIPAWMTVDHAAKTVSMTIVAGQSTVNNSWNFNGMIRGESAIVVPVGYAVEIIYENSDPNMIVHSVGVGQMSETTTALFMDPTPAFSGAISTSAGDPINATKSGASETLTFVADTAGEYALICYVPAHALTGMWIGFIVSEDGSAGIQ